MSLLLLLVGGGQAGPTECAFDGDVFDGDAFEACPPAVVTDTFGTIVRRPARVIRVDDDEDIAVVVAVLRHRLRL